MGRSTPALRTRVDHVPQDNRIDIALDTRRHDLALVADESEWEALIDVAGLEVEALYGCFDERPFDEASREFVWVARKPG